MPESVRKSESLFLYHPLNISCHHHYEKEVFRRVWRQKIISRVEWQKDISFVFSTEQRQQRTRTLVNSSTFQEIIEVVVTNTLSPIHLLATALGRPFLRVVKEINKTWHRHPLVHSSHSVTGVEQWERDFMHTQKEHLVQEVAIMMRYVNYDPQVYDWNKKYRNECATRSHCLFCCIFHQWS